MCIIILNKEGVLPESQLKNASQRNPDGAGIMYAVKGVLHHRKSLQNSEIISEYYRVRNAFPEAPIALHFRIATDGGVTTDNCHPYPVNPDMMLMHNGILTNYANRHTAMSDTRLFIADILTHITPLEIFKPHMAKLIEQAIGSSKFVIMHKNGEVIIVNEGVGVWSKDKRNWYSNQSAFQPPKQKVKYVAGFGGNSLNGRKSAPPAQLKHEWFCDYCGELLLSNQERRLGTCQTCTDLILNG